MRVLLGADAVGGVFTYTVELCGALARRDVATVVAVLGPAPSAERRAALIATGADVRERPFALEWMDGPWADVERAGEWLLELERETAPDVVQLSGYAHGALPFGAPVVVVAHSDVLSWHDAVRGRPAGPEWARYRAALTAGLAGADTVVAPTRAMLDALRRNVGFATPARVIPNGRTPLPSLPKERLVASAGRLWDEAKNAAALERVAPRLPWPVELARGDLEPSGVARLLGRAAIFALPARYEPFGLAALEAASARCALVLGDIPSLREVWGDAASFVPPGDDEALLRTLCRLIDDRPLREELAARARRRAAGLSPGRMADAYLGLYRTLAPAEAVA